MSQTLFDALERIPDPRRKRGVRHPFQPILRFVIWGFASNLVAVEHMVAYAKGPWKRLGKALGFSRSTPPNATTIRRVLALVSVAEIQHVFTDWVSGLVCDDAPLAAAVDGKTLRNVRKGSGDLQQVLNVFAHQVKLTLLQCPIEDGDGESTTLRSTLKSLFEAYPGLEVLTGDSAYAGRSLCEAIIETGKHYLVQIKGNQPKLKAELQKSLAPVLDKRTPDAVEKKR